MCQDPFLEETTSLVRPFSSAATSHKQPLNLCILGGCLQKVQLYLEFSTDVEFLHFGGCKGKHNNQSLLLVI